MRFDLAPRDLADVIGDHHVARIAHRDDQGAPLFLDPDRDDVELLRGLRGDAGESALVRLSREIGARNAALLGERAHQDLLGEELHAHEDVPELAAPLRLLGERGFQLEIGDDARFYEQVANPDAHGGES